MKVVAITGKQACEIVDRADPRIKGDFVKVAIRWVTKRRAKWSKSHSRARSP